MPQSLPYAFIEPIFNINIVDNTSANPTTSIVWKDVPRNTDAITVAATGSTADKSPA